MLLNIYTEEGCCKGMAEYRDIQPLLKVPIKTPTPKCYTLSSPSSFTSKRLGEVFLPTMHSAACERSLVNTVFSRENCHLSNDVSCSNDLLPTLSLSPLYPGITAMPLFPLWLPTKPGKRRSLQHWQQQ